MNTPDIHDDIDAFYDNLTLEQRREADIIDRLEFAADLGIDGDDELLEDAQREIHRLRMDVKKLVDSLNRHKAFIEGAIGRPLQ